MTDKAPPQCQGRFKNNKRCSSPAQHVLRNDFPVFVCGSCHERYIKDDKALQDAFMSAVDISALPDDLLNSYLIALRYCYEELADAAYIAERRFSSVKAHFKIAEEEQKARAGGTK